MKRIALLLILSACAPDGESILLSDRTIELAESRPCPQAWVTGDSEADLDEGLAQLEQIDVEIIERSEFDMITALPGLMVVPLGWWDRPEDSQVRTIAHELTHYCQADRRGDFYTQYVSWPPDRWVWEVHAYREGFVAADAQGHMITIEDLERRAERMRDTYLLGVIDEDQYMAETVRIWEGR